MTTTYRTGRLPRRDDARTLKLARYLNLSRLPTPPAKLDRLSAVRSLPMYRNGGPGALGDCTIAAAGHMIELWTASNHHQATPTEHAIVSAYWATGDGSHHDDTGRNMLDVLRYWQHHGIAGHKIGPYASLKVTDITFLPTACYLFGGLYVGFRCPPNVFTQFDQGLWTEGPVPSPDEGHAVNVADYPDGIAEPFRCVTWGRAQRFTLKWWLQYVDEAWVILSADWRHRDPIPGLDYDQLAADLTALGTVQP